jgi:hypothetical protein
MIYTPRCIACQAISNCRAQEALANDLGSIHYTPSNHTAHYWPSCLLTSLPQSLHNNLQILVPNTTARRALKTSNVHHAILRARLYAILTTALLCTPAGVRMALAMTAIDSTTTAASIVLDSHDRDVGQRQVVVVLATDSSVQGVVRVRQLNRTKSVRHFTAKRKSSLRNLPSPP